MARDLVSWSGLSASFLHLLGELFAAFYEPFRRFTNKTVGYSSTDQVPWTSLVAGASSGAVGGRDPSSTKGRLEFTLLDSGVRKPHVLGQGSDAGSSLLPRPWANSHNILRHILLLFPSGLNITTRTRVKPLRGYSKPRVSAAFSEAWMRPF